MEPLDTRRALDLILPDALLALGGELHLRTCTAAGRARNHFFADREALLRWRLPLDQHVWVAPATRKDQNGKAVGCVAASALWVDVDVKVEGNLAEAEAAIQNFGINPSMIVASGGGGRHYWFALAQPVPLDTPEDRAVFKRTIAALTTLLHGDLQCAQPAAVMRLAGTRNVKPEYGSVPPPVEIVSIDPAAIYDISDIRERLPQPKTKARRKPRAARPHGRGSQPTRPGDGMGSNEEIPHLDECLFIRHCAEKAVELPEGLWVRLAWTLAPFGETGRSVFHRLGAHHPDYSHAESDGRFEYGRVQGYTVTCSGLVEHGFSCPNLNPDSGLCTVGSVRRPADLLRRGTTEAGGIVLRADRTLVRGARGSEREVASFRLAIDEERGGAGIERRLVGRAFCTGRAPVGFDLPAVVGGDRRRLGRELAGLLGTDFRVVEKHLGAAWNAWLDSSDVRRIEVTGDFGFSTTGVDFAGLRGLDGADGRPILDLSHSRHANHLGLIPGSEPDVDGALHKLLFLWPEVGCGSFVTRVLLAASLWALVAPVIEAIDPAVSPLCLWLTGPSGVGKSTSVRVAQCLFGDFSRQGDLVSFGSTPMAIEAAAYEFRGALLVVDDAKRSAVQQREIPNWIGVLQRLQDRTGRSRMRADAGSGTYHSSRATPFIEGEEMLFHESSIQARYFQIVAEEPRCKSPEMLDQLLSELPTLSGIFAAWVRRALTDAEWSTRVHATYRASLTAASMALPASPNQPRIARSIAALAAGWQEILAFAHERGLVDTDSAVVLGHDFVEKLHHVGAEQARVVREVTPGHRWLEDVRTLIASGEGSIEGLDQVVRPGADRLGFVGDDCIYLYPELSVEACNRHLHRSGEPLPAAGTISPDLRRLGWLVRTGDNRAAIRKRHGQANPTVWALRRTILADDP